MNIILMYFSIKYKGDWDAIYKALEDKEKVTLQEVKKLEEEIKAKGWKIKTILDLDYPTKLKEAYKPPFCLYYKGDIELLDNKLVLATGNQVTDIDKTRIEKFVPELEKGYNLLSLSLKGIDEEVLSRTTKPVVYVLPNGLENPYVNTQPKETDLIVTEYPHDVHPTKDSFRNRNRIAAALSDMVVLFSSEKNGAMNNVVTNFLNVGKEIYCFPGDASEKDGNSELIKQGANLITSIKDVTNDNSYGR